MYFASTMTFLFSRHEMVSFVLSNHHLFLSSHEDHRSFQESQQTKTKLRSFFWFFTSSKTCLSFLYFHHKTKCIFSVLSSHPHLLHLRRHFREIQGKRGLGIARRKKHIPTERVSCFCSQEIDLGALRRSTKEDLRPANFEEEERIDLPKPTDLGMETFEGGIMLQVVVPEP